MTRAERQRWEVAQRVKAMLQQRILGSTPASQTLYDELYVHLANECERWAGQAKEG